MLHGHTFAETEENEMTELKDEIKEAYGVIQNDQFIVQSNLLSLFLSRPLNQHFQQDYNSLQCWLRSYKEAVETQKETNKRYLEVARKFFMET